MAEKWRNRIIGSGEEAPDQLLANPDNWRIHPRNQQSAMSGVLNDVGLVQQVVVNQRTGNLIDGHMRVTLAIREQIPKIPVLYVDLDPDEERLIVAALDPLTYMAVTDNDKLTELLESIDLSDMDELFSQISSQAVAPVWFDPALSPEVMEKGAATRGSESLPVREHVALPEGEEKQAPQGDWPFPSNRPKCPHCGKELPHGYIKVGS